MSAATPTACGDAIDVPWIHWYRAHTPLAQLRTSGTERGTRCPGCRVAQRRAVRHPVGVDLSARLRHVERVGGEDPVLRRVVLRRPEELAAVAARCGDDRLLDAVVGVERLARVRRRRGLTGPTDETSRTCGASLGMLRQPLSIVRSCAASGGKSGLVSSNVGFPRSVDSLPAAAISVTPWRCAKFTARVVASMIMRCCSCCSGESAGLLVQLNSHGSM